MDAIFLKLKILWNAFWYALLKQYIQAGKESFEQNKDKELSREIARYYLIDRDRQDRLYQRILALIFLVIGIFLISIGLYIKDNERFTAGCLILGSLLLFADIFIYMELLKKFYKNPLDEDLIKKYNRLIYKPETDESQKS
jgi:hypothetical protein